MKRALLAGLMSLSFLASARAEYWTPQDRDGTKALQIQDVGVFVSYTGFSSAPVIIEGSSIAVYGVLTTTKANGSESQQAWVELRATAAVANAAPTAFATQELLVPPLVVSSTTRNTLYVFNPPRIAVGGLEINTSSGMVGAAVFYRHLATTTVDDFWIPRDFGGDKTFDPSFYGIKAASEVVSGAAANSVGSEGFDFTTAELQVANTPGLLYDIVAGTGNPANYVVFEDSNSTIGPDVADFLPPLFYNTFADSFSPYSKNSVVTFPWPLIFQNGLTQQRTVSAPDRFRIGVRPRRALR